MGDFYRVPEKSPKSSADKMDRACERKDQTLKKIRTLHFPEPGLNAEDPKTLGAKLQGALEEGHSAGFPMAERHE